MSDGSYLSWEEVQRLMLPPNATMLIPPPPPDPADVPALAAGPPPNTDWLDDAAQSPLAITPEEAKSQAEQAEHGPAALRLVANAIAINAVLEYARSPVKPEEVDDKERRRRKELPEG